MIESVVLLSLSPGMQIDCLPLLLVDESVERNSDLRPPGLTIVFAVPSLVVGCLGSLDTPGMIFESCGIIRG